MRRSLRAAVAVAGVVAGVVAGSAVATPAYADPGKSPQWITLVGTCDGVPVVMTDPPGPGPTAFNTATGRVGIGRVFQGINTVTGEIAFEDVYGSALEHANQNVATCDFPVPPEFSPDGTANWVFRVIGFFH
jgi:hypothetical protein